LLKFAADENFNNDILRGWRRQCGDIDVVRIQDTELSGKPDPDVLIWCVEEDRILLTHDLATIPRYAMHVVAAGESLPGVIAVNRSTPKRSVIDDLVLIAEASRPDDWANKVVFLPL
jgi:hypothetical protein